MEKTVEYVFGKENNKLWLVKKIIFRESLILILLFSTLVLVAQNPITPPGMYLADPEAHVWGDGRLYIYGSRDESDDYWCSYSHNVISTSDMVQWQVDERAFASKGIGDEVDYHDQLLFAPDCAYRDGTYYLYYCSPDENYTEGVATSKSPNGPFTQGSHIKGAYQIDPAVLIDTDGNGYYYWGQGTAKVARLKPNLMEIDTTTIVEPLDSLGNLYFHEGASIRKIGEKYYMVFADESREWRPTSLGYAISHSPMGPFVYQGVIIDNNGSDPAVWNNHGSIEQFNDQWYVFYHRSTNNSKKFRKICIEPITINADGSIEEVEMTSQGAGKPLSAFSIIQAEWACGLSGNCRVLIDKNTDVPMELLGQIRNGDGATYKYINFDNRPSTFRIKTYNTNSGIIELRIDGPKGELIGKIEISNAHNESGFNISESKIQVIEGIHALHLNFQGSKDLFDIDWFSFY